MLINMLKDTAFVNRKLVHCSTHKITHYLTTNIMCCLLANQSTSVCTKHKQKHVIKYPVTFFLTHPTTTREDDLFLTDITLSNSIISEAIKELSRNSVGGHDVIHTHPLINGAEGLSPVLKISFFTHSLSVSLLA